MVVLMVSSVFRYFTCILFGLLRFSVAVDTSKVRLEFSSVFSLGSFGAAHSLGLSLSLPSFPVPFFLLLLLPLLPLLLFSFQKDPRISR